MAQQKNGQSLRLCDDVPSWKKNQLSCTSTGFFGDVFFGYPERPLYINGFCKMGASVIQVSNLWIYFDGLCMPLFLLVEQLELRHENQLDSGIRQCLDLHQRFS